MVNTKNIKYSYLATVAEIEDFPTNDHKKFDLRTEKVELQPPLQHKLLGSKFSNGGNLFIKFASSFLLCLVVGRNRIIFCTADKVYWPSRASRVDGVK